MSNYRQPTTIAFDAATAPTNPNALSDEFAASRPGILNQPGFAVVDPKWKLWDPGSVLTFKAIDVRRQMLLLRTNGDKQWCGLMQNLPLPAVGHSVELAIYARIAFADIDTDDTFDPTSGAIILGEDLVAHPDTSALRSVELSVQKTGSPPTILAPSVVSQTYGGFDFPGTPLALSPYAQDVYLRVRLKQALAAGPLWTIDAYWDVSMSDGIGWMPLVDQIGGSVPYKQLAIGVRSQANVEVGHYFDFLRVELTAVDDIAATTGGVQTLGAV